MEKFNRKKHWEHIYQTKELTEVSWFQPRPETSLEFIQSTAISKDAKIIDVGGGDSFLVDHLLDLGYQNITVLDISKKAIERAKKRLGERSNTVQWIVADAAAFTPSEMYDCWHDRAAFHFLTDPAEIANYVATANRHITKNGHLILGTFSDEGPEKCSGIPIKQYTEDTLKELFSTNFKTMECKRTEHSTPFDTSQNFVFCRFAKRNKERIENSK